MQIKNTERDFGMIAKTLHWVMAAIMISLLCLGLYMNGLPIGLQKLKFYGWHKEFGVLVLMLAVARVAWRLRSITPSLTSLPWWERYPARAMHYAFYLFMFAMPITGWMMSSAVGLPVSFFGLFTLPNLVAPDEHSHVLLAEVHRWLAYVLIAAIAGHVGAALKHHFVDKDDILRRML